MAGVSRVLELERKFAIRDAAHALAVTRALKDAGAVMVGEKSFTDAYYDVPDYQLCLQDIWLRQRDSLWELKFSSMERDGRARGKAADAYIEVVGASGVCGVLEEADVAVFAEGVPEEEAACEEVLRAAVGDGRLTQLAAFTTERQSWKLAVAGGREMAVVLDETDFGCRVGELELLLSADTDDAERAAAEEVLDDTAARLKLGDIARGKLESVLSATQPDLFARLSDTLGFKA
eukprot:PLAT2981.1.p1 GENE.PLAT2981.1~~PLAT2981.1.p1  ORF type:complete len:250 (+),score=86.58 PLAT2981.1:49-750(+)